MAKKTTPKADPTASTDPYGTFAMVYETMLLHPSFQKLSPGAKNYYLLCRAQATSKKGRACLYKHGDAEGKTYSENCFVFPSAHQKRFGVHRGNGRRYMNNLIEAGFVECIEMNQYRHKPNVFRFSTKWKDTS